MVRTGIVRLVVAAAVAVAWRDRRTGPGRDE